MADDAKAEEMIDRLRDTFAQRIRDSVADLPPQQALQLADALCYVQLEVLAGMRVHYRARAIDGEAIAEDWRRGLTLQEITRKHGVSRPTAYRYHPSGKAKPARRAC